MNWFPSARILKRCGIGLAILLGLLLIGNGIMSWRTEARLRRMVKRIRTEGQPASIAELQPSPIPDQQNAAASIDRLSQQLAQFTEDYGRFYNSDLGNEYTNLEPGKALSAEMIDAIRSILDQHSDLALQIADVVDAPNYSSTADFSRDFSDFLETELPRMSRLREIARYVDWQVHVLVADGHREEAIHRAINLLRLAALSESEPLLVNYLITVAVRSIAIQSLDGVLEAGPVSVQAHEEVDEALNALEDRRGLTRALNSERALSISASFQHGWHGVPPSIGWLLGWPVKRQFLAALDYVDQIIPFADQPYHEIEPMFAAGGKLATPTGEGMMADLLVPALQAAFKAAGRDRAMMRSLRVYNALLRYETEHGHAATGLAELPLPDTATVDPFSGRPLCVTRTDKGWNVYSVGENKTDDGGDFSQHQDLGFGPGNPTDKASID